MYLLQRVSTESVNWETLFNNKIVNKQVSIFNETIMDIFSNFVPNKQVTFDDSNPSWVNDFVKGNIKWKHKIYQTYIENGGRNPVDIRRRIDVETT